MKFIYLIYWSLWLIVGSYIFLEEINFLPHYYLNTENSEITLYLLNLIAICLSISGSFFACRLFVFKLVKRQISNTNAKKNFLKWNAIRLILNFLSIFPSLFIYYGTMSKSAFYCFLIGLTASLFCIPPKHFNPIQPK